MIQPPTARQELVVQHNNRTLSGTIVPSPMLDVYRFEYRIPGEPTNRFLELPKALFQQPLNPGMGTLVTIAITNVGMVEVPAVSSINGHKL